MRSFCDFRFAPPKQLALRGVGGSRLANRTYVCTYIFNLFSNSANRTILFFLCQFPPSEHEHSFSFVNVRQHSNIIPIGVRPQTVETNVFFFMFYHCLLAGSLRMISYAFFKCGVPQGSNKNIAYFVCSRTAARAEPLGGILIQSHKMAMLCDILFTCKNRCHKMLPFCDPALLPPASAACWFLGELLVRQQSQFVIPFIISAARMKHSAPEDCSKHCPSLESGTLKQATSPDPPPRDPPISHNGRPFFRSNTMDAAGPRAGLFRSFERIARAKLAQD